MKYNWKYGILEDAVNKGSSNISLNKIKDDDGDYPVFGAKGFAQNVSFYQQESEYLGIIKDGAGIGRVSRHPEKSSILATMQYILPKKGFDIQFINYFLDYIDFEKYRTGSTIPHIYYKDYKSEPFPLVNIDEQKRIVAKLDECFEAIDKARANVEKNLNNAKELFESYLQGVFESKVHGSKYEILNSLSELIVDCEHKTAPTQTTGYPSIRTPNIGKGELILDGVNRVSQEVYLQWTRRATPKANDLILAREAPAGNIAVIPDNLDVCLGQRTVLIRPKKERIVSKYLAYLILSRDVQEKLLSHSTGATVQHINMKDIRAFKIYNLSNIHEQIQIVNQLDDLKSQTQSIESNYQQELDALDELKKSILQKAFSGELTIDNG
jgi:type I restriction enzyme, S subunit